MTKEMTDCPTCEYHKQRAQIWRDEVYRLAGHPLPRKETMTHEEQIAKLTEMLEIQQKLHETAIDMLKTAIEIAVQKERKRILDVIGDNQCECRCAEVVRGQA
jgi:hypothetical protein